MILRRYVEGDAQDLYEYLSNPEVVKYEPYKPMDPDEVKSNLAWRISTDEMIAVELKSSHKMIGNVYLGKREFDALEMGYVFNQDYWGKAECDPQNQGSWRLLESLGFEREAYLKQNVYFWKDDDNKPLWKDTYIYARLNPHMER